MIHDRMIIRKNRRPISKDFVLDEIRPWFNCLRKQTCNHMRHFTVLGPTSMPVALEQLPQNPRQALWLCFKQLVKHFSEFSKVVLDFQGCAGRISRNQMLLTSWKDLPKSVATDFRKSIESQ